MATTKITNPELFDLASLNTALQLPSGTTAERPTSPSTGEWRYNTDNNLIEFYDGGSWRELSSEEIPPVPSENFNTVLYTGNGTLQSITGVGFQPDFVWIKARDRAGEWHMLSDSSRGTNSQLFSNASNAQDTKSTVITSFDSDGFSIGSDALVNFNGANYVAWCWKAKGGTTSSNTNGTITSTVQVNTKTGTSIVQWTGTGSAGTLGHGLSSAPELIMVKDTTVAYNWYVYTTATGSNIGFEGLNTDAASFAASSQMTSTSTLITNVPSIASLNTSGSAMIIYAFHSVAGYSKIGSYTGTGSTSNRPIINTGFEPAFVMIKNSTTADDWMIHDNKRNPSNPRDKYLRANTSDQEGQFAEFGLDFLTNGFQVGPTTNNNWNGSGQTYIYLAFASDPSAAPVLADSFNTSLYTGNGGTQSITGLGFSPNLVWLKERGQAANHRWLDTLRGATKAISSSLSAAEFTDSTGLTSFDTDGFTLGANVDYNNNGGTFVAWNWKANPIPSILTDGTIQSIASANQAAGFSIVKYVGNGVQGATVAHGLGSAPDMIIIKDLSSSEVWLVGNSESGWTKAMHLDLTNADNASNLYWDDAAPTSTVFSIGAFGTSYNVNGNQYIAYCFKSTSGFSKIGSYSGGSIGSSNVITTGFQPDWIMIKRTDTADDWTIIDSVRGDSASSRRLIANTDEVEKAATSIWFPTSTGFYFSGTGASYNASGGAYIYAAFKIN